MKQGENNFLKNNKFFLSLLCAVTLFMGICYANVGSSALFIIGKTETNELKQVVITNVELYDIENSSADVINSEIVNYTSTIISSNLILSNTDPNSSITMKVTVYNNSDIKSAYAGYLYSQGLYSNQDIVISVTGIDEGEIIEPRTSKDFFVTFTYKDGQISPNNELTSLIDYQFKNVHNISYKYFYEDEYPKYVYDKKQMDIILPKSYQSINIFYSDDTPLINGVNYTYATDGDSYNVLSLLNIDADIEIRNFTNFCSNGSKLADCLITTDYGSNNLVEAGNKIENKVANLDKIEPYLIYNEDIQYDLVSSSIASNYNSTTTYYYTLEPPTFNSENGYYVLPSGGQYATIENLVSQKNGTKKYTCLATSASVGNGCSSVYVIYALNTNNRSEIKITNADKYYHILDEDYSSNPGLYATADDYTNSTGLKSYYYRGEVNNNWISFGGFLWRIVRINGDGSIRIIYSGTKDAHTGTDTSITNPFTSQKTTEYNVNQYGGTYVGYMNNPSMVTNMSPDSSVILRNPSNNSTTNLNSFITYNKMNNYTKYYFFTSFDMNTNCKDGICTFTCTNFNGTTGSNCKYALWSDMARDTNNYMKNTDIDQNKKTGSYYGSTTNSSSTGNMFWYYKGTYKYSCLANQISASQSGRTLTVTCTLPMEILGVVYSNSTKTISDTQAKVRYYGYFSNSREDAIKNESDSTIKSTIDEWYRRNLLSYENYIQDGIFCNDREFAADNPAAGDGYLLNSYTHYGPRYRIYSSKTAKLTCTNINNDGFTLKTTGGKSSISGVSGFGNNASDYPIGLLTIDEASFAGGLYNSQNLKYYLYNGTHFWTMSPSYINNNGGHSFAWRIYTDGTLNNVYVSLKSGVRPVINLKTGILYSSGSGTENDPYEVMLQDNN